ncbi:MAG: FAD-dependent oxidoreductase [Pseudomonadota bacterium]
MRVERATRSAEGGWELAWTRGEGPRCRERGFAGRAGTLRAEHLVLAVDVAGAAELAEGSVDLAPILGDLSVFKGRPAVNVRCFWDRAPDHTWGESGVFAGATTADNYFWLHRFQDRFAAWHRATCGAVSECHVYAPDSKHELSDEELMRRCREDMENAFPELAGHCIHTAIIRNRATHINFPVGCAERFPTVRTAAPDLFLCGDWIDGGEAVLYMERACQTGIAAANGVLGSLGLSPWPVLGSVAPPPSIRLLQRALRKVDRHFPDVWPTG